MDESFTLGFNVEFLTGDIRTDTGQSVVGDVLYKDWTSDVPIATAGIIENRILNALEQAIERNEPWILILHLHTNRDLIGPVPGSHLLYAELRDQEREKACIAIHTLSKEYTGSVEMGHVFTSPGKQDYVYMMRKDHSLSWALFDKLLRREMLLAHRHR